MQLVYIKVSRTHTGRAALRVGTLIEVMGAFLFETYEKTHSLRYVRYTVTSCKKQASLHNFEVDPLGQRPASGISVYSSSLPAHLDVLCTLQIGLAISIVA